MILFLLLIIIHVCPTHNYKILFYSPNVATSHVKFMGLLADTLIEAGHQVVIFMPIIDPTVLINGTERAEVIRFDVSGGDPHFYDSWQQTPIRSDPFDDEADILNDHSAAAFVEIWTQLCRGLIRNKHQLTALREQKFDLAFTEAYDYCAFGIFHMAKIPAQIITSAVPFTETLGDLFGVPQPPSYVPSVWRGFTDQMTYSERVANIFATRAWRRMNADVLSSQNALFRQSFGADFPDLRTLAVKTAVVFVNADELVEFARPITHRVVYIGGIAIPKVKPLSKKFLDILGSSHYEGVVLVSFGSMANSTMLPLEKKMELLTAMAAFPTYKFIWKYEQPDRDAGLFLNYTNVHPIEWLPQVDLLNHPRVKAFVTHGGQNSMTETIYSGTPTAAVPLFGDQDHNVAVAVERGVSVFVDKKNINAPTLIAALNRVLNDKTFSENARRLAQMLAKKPLKAQELVVKYTKFVAEFPNFSFMDIAGRDFSFIKYFSLDIFIPAGLIILLALFIAFKTILFLCQQRIVGVLLKSKRD